MRRGLSLAFLLVDVGGGETWTNLFGLIEVDVQIGTPEAVASRDQDGCFEIVATARQLGLRGIFGQVDCQLGVGEGGFEITVALVRRRELCG